jgi:hypothetical protein
VCEIFSLDPALAGMWTLVIRVILTNSLREIVVELGSNLPRTRKCQSAFGLREGVGASMQWLLQSGSLCLLLSRSLSWLRSIRPYDKGRQDRTRNAMLEYDAMLSAKAV